MGSSKYISLMPLRLPNQFPLSALQGGTLAMSTNAERIILKLEPEVYKGSIVMEIDMVTLRFLNHLSQKAIPLMRICIFTCIIASLFTSVSITDIAASGKHPQTRAGISADILFPEFRAAWVATVANIDWPSKPNLPVETQKLAFITILNQLQKMHMNAIVVQIKPTADAFYPSRYWPWSQYLTGTQGRDPGYDPLAFMITEAHKRHIEFHAWFNPYRISMQDHLDQLAPNSPARQHPAWVVSYGGRLYFDPGIPDVRNFIVSSISEVVRNYNIDAIHFDDYFYPYPIARQDFPDEATYQHYGTASFSHKADWRRNNVNQLVQDVSRTIKQIKPCVQFGISPFGVWRNKEVDPTGSATHAGPTDYDFLYADTRTWIRRGWLDYIAPQLYWAIGFAPAAYEQLVPWWVNEVAGTHVRLYIGQAGSKIATGSGPWSHAEEMPEHLIFNRQFKAVRGNIFFSMKDLFANRLGFTDWLIKDTYNCEAPSPK